MKANKIKCEKCGKLKEDDDFTYVKVRGKKYRRKQCKMCDVDKYYYEKYNLSRKKKYKKRGEVKEKEISKAELARIFREKIESEIREFIKEMNDKSLIFNAVDTLRLISLYTDRFGVFRKEMTIGEELRFMWKKINDI